MCIYIYIYIHILRHLWRCRPSPYMVRSPECRGATTIAEVESNPLRGGTEAADIKPQSKAD